MAPKTAHRNTKASPVVRQKPGLRKPRRTSTPAFRSVRGVPPTVSGQVSVAAIRRGLQVGRPLFARLTGFSERAIADWEASKPLSGASLLKMREIARLHAALRTVMRQQFIGTWLDTPNPAFDGLKPVEVIERGEIDRIWRMVHEVGSGEPT